MLNFISNHMTTFLAINPDDYLDIFKQYDEFFSKFDILTYCFRLIGWLVLKGLIKIASLMNIAVDKMFDFLNFLDSEEVIQFYNSIKPLIWVVFLFAIIYMGYCYIVAQEKPKGILTNLFLFGATIFLLPYLMTQMTQIVSYTKEGLAITKDESGYELLIPYITDLLYLDSIDFNEEMIANGNLNAITSNSAENIKYIDINEVLDPGDYNLVNEELFKKEPSFVMNNGNIELGVSKIKKDKFIIRYTPYYYRYHVNFWTAIVYLLSLIIVLAFSSIKLVQLEYELVTERILTPFIAAGDLTGGQKIRKALIGILNAFITIICVLFLQKLFVLATEYINTRIWSDNMAGNGVIKVLLIVSGALFVVDGPNFFEQIFGVDAGLKSVGQALQSAYYGSQMLGGLGRATTGVARKLGGLAKGTAGAGATIAGMLSGMKENGAFQSNNQKVSQDMAGGIGIVPLDPSHAIEAKPEERSSDARALPGGGQPKLPGSGSNAKVPPNGNTSPNQGTTANKFKGQSSETFANQSGDTYSGQSGVQDDIGRNNLNSVGNTVQDGQSMNDSINNALNGMNTINEASGTDGWVQSTVKNSATAKYLQSNFDKGKGFGKAVGASVVNGRQRRTRKKNNMPPIRNQKSKSREIAPVPGQNKDNLK